MQLLLLQKNGNVPAAAAVVAAVPVAAVPAAAVQAAVAAAVLALILDCCPS